MTHTGAAMFMLPLAIAALITTTVTFSSSAGTVTGSDAAYQEFGNIVGNNDAVTIDTPTGRFSNNPISAVITYATFAKDWLVYFAIAMTLDYPWFEGWAQPIRYIILAVCYLPVAFVLSLDLLNLFASFIGGAYSR